MPKWSSLYKMPDKKFSKTVGGDEKCQQPIETKKLANAREQNSKQNRSGLIITVDKQQWITSYTIKYLQLSFL